MQPRRLYARVRFAKRGPARFVGHLDLARAFDRIVRRAALPVVYSGGFNPRARISFGQPLPVGVESEAELCVVDLARPAPADEIARRLQEQCPRGLEILQVQVRERGRRSPLANLSRAEYRAEIALELAAEPALRAAGEALLNAETIELDRRTKSGQARVNVRPGILNLAYIPGPTAALEMTLRIAGDAVAKPDEAIRALNAALPEGAQVWVVRLVRTALD